MNAKLWYWKLSLPDFFGSAQLSPVLGTPHILWRVLCLQAVRNCCDIILIIIIMIINSGMGADCDCNSQMSSQEALREKLRNLITILLLGLEHCFLLRF